MKTAKAVKSAGVIGLSLFIGSLLIANGPVQTNAKANEKLTASPSQAKEQTALQSEKSSLARIANEDESIVLTKLSGNVWAHTSYNEWNGIKIDHNGLIVSTPKGAVLIEMGRSKPVIPYYRPDRTTYRY